MARSQAAVGDTAIQAGGPPQVVAVTASPMTITNLSQRVEAYYLTMPTGVTATVAKAGITLFSLLTPAATTVAALFMLQPGGAAILTYNAGAPTLTRDVL